MTRTLANVIAFSLIMAVSAYVGVRKVREQQIAGMRNDGRTGQPFGGSDTRAEIEDRISLYEHRMRRVVLLVVLVAGAAGAAIGLIMNLLW